MNIFKMILPGLCLVLALVAMPACADDFGDAPDGAPTDYPVPFEQTGSFPTLLSSGGAQVTDLTQATLGPSASDEADANDPADTDGEPNLNPSNTDVDNGIVNFVVFLTSIPATAQMTVNVSGPAGSAGGTYWVNVLIDMDMDGQWDTADPIAPGVTEWAVRNFPVLVAPGVEQDIKLPGFAYGTGALPDGAWMRILLTRERITDPAFAGGGSYSAGEIEDHIVDLPEIGEPPKSNIPLMICNRVERFPAGVAAIPFSCNIYNVGRDPGTARYLMTQVIPGANVAPVNLPPGNCAPAGPAALNCAPTPAIAPTPIGLLVPGLTPSFVATFTATRAGPLPSRWTYRAMAEDPQAVITPKGVIIGFDDSTGDIDFVGEEPEQKGKYEPKEQAE